MNLYNYPVNPIQWFDPLGLKKACKERILEALNLLNHNEKYSYESNYGFGENTNKCNLFVNDVLEKAEHNAQKENAMA